MIFLYVLVGFVVLFMLFVYKKSGSFFKSLISSALGGIGALCAVNAISYFVPLSIGINWVTVAFSSLFSVPGVIFLLVADAMIF